MGMVSINLAILLFLVVAAWAYLLYEGFYNEKRAKETEKRNPEKDKE